MSEISINTGTVVISQRLHVEYICILRDRLGTPVRNLSPPEAIEFETIPTLRRHLEEH